MAKQYAREIIGNKEKALLHVAKSGLGMTEDEYRDLLGSVGCQSSTELTRAKFDVVMRRLEAAGFAPRSRSVKKSGPPADAKRPLMGKIGAILGDAGLPWAYADGMSRRMFGVQTVRWCTVEQLHKIVAALSIYQRRRAGRSAEEVDNG